MYEKPRQSHKHHSLLSLLIPVLLSSLLLIVFFHFVVPIVANASMKSPPPKTVDVIVIGDQVVDIAYHLGVMPKAMAIRGSIWPLAKSLKLKTQILGCPNHIVKKKESIPDALKKFGIKRVIVERRENFCLYKPGVSPENVVPLLEGTGAVVEYVDFSKGLESAVRQTAKLMGAAPDKADEVMTKYNSAMKKVTAAISASSTDSEDEKKRVVILNGTYQPSSGKFIVRVEVPDSYSDQFLLEKLGCVNVGEAFNPKMKKAAKGHYPVRKIKKGMDLAPLAAADPDVIIITGDAFAVQKSMADYQKTHPEFDQIKAVKDMAIYALPQYVGSGVLEYPDVLKKWASALL